MIGDITFTEDGVITTNNDYKLFTNDGSNDFSNFNSFIEFSLNYYLDR